MSDVISIILPDGSAHEYPAATTATDVASSIGKRLAKAAVAAAVTHNGGPPEEVDLSRPLSDGDRVSIITGDTDAGRHVLRHSTAHVMAQAVTQLFPGAKFSIGPAIENGFLLRLRPAGRAHVPRGRPSGDRSSDPRDRRRRPAVRALGRVD